MLPNQDFVPAADLPPTPALPLAVLEEACAALPPSQTRRIGGRLCLSRGLAEAYCRVVDTDFSQTAWQLDRPQDRETVARWLALGGSFIADFAADPRQPRIFAWAVSPVPQAAQAAMRSLKGRDGRWIPTSVLAPIDQVRGWVDPARAALPGAFLDAVLDLGPVGFRFAVRDGVVPSYFSHFGLGGAYVQVILPGRSPIWDDLLEVFHRQSGHRFMGLTSANFSSRGSQRSGGTHKDLAELQADMGFLGVPILSGPVVLAAGLVPAADRSAAYKELHARFVEMSEAQRAQSTELLPTSVSILALTREPDQVDLVRHGSLHQSVLRQAAEGDGVTVTSRVDQRLELSHYVGDLLARFPLFSGLEARHIAEISHFLESRTFEAGDVLVRKGEEADRMFFVASGAVTVAVVPEVRLGVGDYFGEIALVEGVSRTATVRGVESGVLLVLTAHVLSRLMEALPGLADQGQTPSK